MDFDEFTVALLVQRHDASVLDAGAAAALQDAHLAYLADLHAAGCLLAAGPLIGDPFHGLSIFRLEPEQARARAEQDPAVRAGQFSVTILRWKVPGGAMAFSPTRFPRSVAEALGAEFAS